MTEKKKERTFKVLMVTAAGAALDFLKVRLQESKEEARREREQEQELERERDRRRQENEGR